MNNLKSKRKEFGLKQYELASLLGCSPKQLSSIENNKQEANTSFKKEAAKLFNIPVSEMFPSKGTFY